MATCFHTSKSKCDDADDASLAKGGPPSPPLVHDHKQPLDGARSSGTLKANPNTSFPTKNVSTTRVETSRLRRPAMVAAAFGLGLVLLTLMIVMIKDRFDLARTKNPDQESGAQNEQASIEINSYKDLLGIQCKTIDRPYYELPEFDVTLDPWMYSKCMCDDVHGVVIDIDLSIPEHLWDNIGDAIDNPPLVMAADQQFYCILRNVTGFEDRM